MRTCACGTCAECLREMLFPEPKETGNDPSVKCHCGNYIDPDVCWCGDAREGHASAWTCGHSFVPMGCDCLKGVRPVNWEEYTGLSKEQLEALKL